MNYGLYKVTGSRRYRGHQPGTVFVARLEPAAAQRATVRGDIKLIRLIQPTIQPDKLNLNGWGQTTS